MIGERVRSRPLRCSGTLEWQPDVLIHLGDNTDYSGTPTELASNFKSLIDEVMRRERPDLAVYLSAGNHDMYVLAGGVGFYDLIQKLNPGELRQPASFFCLRSNDEKWTATVHGLHDYSPFNVDDVVTGP